MFVWRRFVGLFGLALCVVFIVSLNCPFFEAYWLSSLSIYLDRKLHLCFWRVYLRQNGLEVGFVDIRVAVSFVVVSGFGLCMGLFWCLHVFVYFFARRWAVEGV